MTPEENRSTGEKIALNLMYDGSRFCGWQVQKNARSVQSTLQDALEGVLGFRPDVCGCSRTDSGVHANDYVCHILREGVKLDCQRLVLALNAYLRNSGLAVTRAQLMDEDFHARYSCLGKEYIYKIWNEKYMNPHLAGKAMFYPGEINIDALTYVSQEFKGTHDFCSFMTKGSKNENNTVRTVKYFEVEKDGGLVTIRVCADGFLYNMVRIMVGTYLDLSRKNAPQGSLKRIIDAKNRSFAGDTAPAEGLYLNRIFY